MKVLICAIALTLGIFSSAHASGYMMSNRAAWMDSKIIIVRGKVTQESHDTNTRVGSYVVAVSEVIKNENPDFPNQVTVVDKNDRSTAMISLRQDENAVLFLAKQNDNYFSTRQINLDTENGVQQLAALRTFLELMAIPQKDKRTASCIEAWQNAQSQFAKRAVLDAMFETRNTNYAPLLLTIAKSQDSADIRSWAITILTGLGSYDQIKELIPVFDAPDYDVKRQLLIAFGSNKIREAAPKIEALLIQDFETQPKSLTENLRSIAQEALEKINGENTNKYWNN